MCELASWIPSAVAVTLRSETAQPIIEWLTSIRQAIEEYDPLVTVAPPEEEPETPDSKFDEILSHLGKEIYKLDEYQRNLAPTEKEVSMSILNIFDECLERISEEKQTKNSESECESTLSDVSFVTSTPASVKVNVNNNNSVNTIFDKGEGTPIPPRRVRLRTYNISISDMESNHHESESDSDSESTCWSYKECSTDDNDVNTYAAAWEHSSGYHNSDEILRRILSQHHHHATISRLSFDTANDLVPDSYSVYSLHEVGECKDRCVDSGSVAMTPDRPADDGGYEPVRDAIQTDENIYEEIEYGYSYTDEGCSCGGSVEVESISISASSEGVGRESPLYQNLRDHDAYAVPPDVIYWKNSLLDPFYNEDEEDEWITPEECAVYSRDQRPPLVIPRITQQYRTPRQRIPSGSMYPEESPKSEKRPLRSHGYAQLDNWSPTSDRCRRDLDAAFKASTDSPPFARGPMNRFGGSTENLLTCNARRPNYLQLPASSSGDSLDVDVERREPTGAYRNRKSRSMQVPKNRLRSPVPLPRQHIMMQQPTNEIVVLKEGLVKRTKFWSSHKKVKKNWIECYMVLTPNALLFYKDQKTFNNYKQSKPGTPPSPSAPITFILPLKDASATDCTTKHTKRSRAMCLDLNGEGYLIQDMESDENARHWLYSIQEVIHSMSNGLRPRLRISPPPTYQSSTTDAESLSRTPPSSRHPKTKQKAGGDSNEDSEDQETQKSYVRSKLRQFFAKRPAMDQLVKTGIYKDEPVFGRKLEDVRCSSGSKVPDFVVACVDKIESSKENMCTDGLYRASGNLSQVQKIRLEVDQSNMSVINNNNDIHVLTGSLKLFFRELKEPLIPFCLFDRVLNACSIKNRDARIKEFREIVKLLPEHNRDTLKFLLTHLLKVTKYAEHNRMHTANLAIVFGPTLLWAPAEKAHNIAVDCIQQNNVVDILLTEFKEIFPDN